MIYGLMRRWALLEGESGDAPAGGAPAAAPAPATPAPAAPATPASPDAGLTPPGSLLDEKPEDAPKPDEAKPEDAKPDDKPIEYEPFKLPDGVEVNAEKLGEFSKIAAESGLTQEVAQKIVDLYSSELKAMTEAPMRAWTELQNTWRDQVKNDPEIGGANLDKNLATTKAGLKNLLGEGADKFFAALNVTGAGNNPEIIRGLFKAAQSHAPASPVAGRPASGQKSAGSTLYPTMNGLGNGHEG
jgi:hypothetical protein